jgi:hypothetical protein
MGGQMPTFWNRAPNDVITTYLGQFDRVTANEVAGRLEAAGIEWWYKEPGFISVIWEFGVRLFVDRERLDEATAIADAVRAEAALAAEAAQAREAAGEGGPVGPGEPGAPLPGT